MSDNLADMSYEQLVAELSALRERRAKARERPAAGTAPKIRTKTEKKDTKISAGAWALLDGDDDTTASEEDPARDEKSLDELGDDLTK